MRYELFYQPSIQGRGEFIRLALEDAGADYVDVARAPNFGRPGIMKFLEDPSLERPPFAPPFLKAGSSDLPDRQHSPVSGAAARSRAEKRSKPALGTSTATDDCRLAA